MLSLFGSRNSGPRSSLDVRSRALATKNDSTNNDDEFARAQRASVVETIAAVEPAIKAVLFSITNGFIWLTIAVVANDIPLFGVILIFVTCVQHCDSIVELCTNAKGRIAPTTKIEVRNPHDKVTIICDVINV